MTTSERDTARQLLAGGWSIVRVAHAIQRQRQRYARSGIA